MSAEPGKCGQSSMRESISNLIEVKRIKDPINPKLNI
jgi:pentose-5-phosphate-3-epimerase